MNFKKKQLPIGKQKPVVKVVMPTNPRNTRPGYHLVRVNDKTQIEVKNGEDDTQARQRFVDKMHKHDQAFYNNLEMLTKPLEG